MVSFILTASGGCFFLCLGSEMGMSMSMMIARWSEMVRSEPERWFMVMPVEQARSRMCPRLWVGKLMCCIMLKHLSKSRNSVAILQSVESMWMLKSPRSRMEGEMELGEEFR